MTRWIIQKNVLTFKTQFHKCVKVSFNILKWNSQSHMASFGRKKPFSNWALFKTLESSWRIVIQIGVTLSIWRFKIQLVIKRMIENQIGSSILTIKMFYGWVKWLWLKCDVGSSFQGLQHVLWKFSNQNPYVGIMSFQNCGLMSWT